MLGSSLKLNCALLLSTGTSKRKFIIHSVMSSERVGQHVRFKLEIGLRTVT
jgi:hypothetical protein